jgi:hypothetical protein
MGPLSENLRARIGFGHAIAVTSASQVSERRLGDAGTWTAAANVPGWTLALGVRPDGTVLRLARDTSLVVVTLESFAPGAAGPTSAPVETSAFGDRLQEAGIVIDAADRGVIVGLGQQAPRICGFVLRGGAIVASATLTPASVASQLSLVQLANGDAMAFWASSSSEVWASTLSYDASAGVATWSTPANILASSGFGLFSVVGTPGGELTLVYQTVTLLARRRLAGAWTPDVDIGSGLGVAPNAFGVQISSGGTVAVASAKTNGEIRVSTVAAGASAWQGAVVDTSASNYRPSPGYAQSGDLVIVWSRQKGSSGTREIVASSCAQ